MRLIGKHGEILLGNDESTAVVKNKLLEKKYGSIVVFDNKDLEKWLKRLKISYTEDGRIRLSSW